MALIENRRFLTGSSPLVLIVAATQCLEIFVEFPGSPLLLLLVVPVGAILISASMSAIKHAIKHDNYGWLLPIAAFGFLGVYAYGFMVAAEASVDRV